ncbi:DUF3099 domain-containing protein [Corynebacterium marinum]|jgi:hypothetical protein|uniref:DUF3099 domain-containing protein n=2 Tax=Corynebacterium marinum TaxID=349751 RepID=A0A0B6TWC1_9CORY|nr:DUF3099 domain-containing protein [Corynebacterium marinum]AJK69046.1 hypothetical protein B840_07240 [Corynebacterium marinum DSM 44953]NLF91365.1 DUF3099 domain-containing protein [Corynebacterium marinum]GGO17945.1 hypothetical protein GCM10010980_15770 [Corynebacterium marinum]
MDQDPFDTVDDPSADAGDGDASRAGRRFRLRRRAELITDARRSPAEDLRRRERIYAWLQAARLPALLLSAGSYLWLGDWFLSGLLFIISIPLPWIAVVIANGKGEVRDKRTRNVYKPQAAREYNAHLAAEAARRAQLGQAEHPELPPADPSHPAADEHEIIDHTDEPDLPDETHKDDK